MIFDSKNITTDEFVWRHVALPRISPFALPYENFNMALFKLDFDEILFYEFLMKEEENILKLEPHSETTGLNEKSISSRWDKYNLFTRYEGNEYVDSIRNQVLTNYQKFCRLTSEHAEKIFVHCWYNIVRKGDFISEHSHDAGTYTYLSGNVYVRGYDKQSETLYRIPSRDEELIVKNNSGDFTLFPAWLPHQTNVYRGEQPRITIGMNIYPMRFYDDFKQNDEQHNWLPYIYTS